MVLFSSAGHTGALWWVKPMTRQREEM